MTTTVISNQTPFGQMSNASISRLIQLNTTLERLQSAIATASAGFDGTPGTQFEVGGLFGVQPSETPGEQGTAYSYAMGRLNEEWATFWAAASPFVDQLDNGAMSF